MKEPSNPFYVTSNQLSGMSILARYGPVDELEDDKSSEQTSAIGGFDLSFQYSRESDRIGEGVQISDSALAQVLAQKETLCEVSRRKRLKSTMQAQGNRQSNEKCPNDTQKEVEQVLASYTHNPKEQNPLYGTTANDYGQNKPSLATYNPHRITRNQTFSRGFNGMMFKDQGLNTSMTRSNVHEQLDPMFG
mmetsp:Transcript_33270/g.48134  ORF Transcript_33270/g.48134 Transcript_33270/m.48134 type:complete len:191 (-) Transcript_33270:408-980(-)|eukprot:CAMPEP_0116009864 /NCGR_PEP_ID=MMETSP0321-20121206/3675_1 /TAXON_ID=163516 /ORGANISM="Leptocylindrus danicus var. danicus, Strain B650" /LENGTH=190 /DNA_ID=CAMNT_0003478885 /DNA_START=3617 /DNA_END=4189 /DNA_ORIENTATION=-